MSDSSIKAQVIDVITRGRQSYVVAINSEIGGTVTFSLHASVWREKSMPHKHDSVYLDDVRKKNHGWRAYVARFWRPSDQKQQKPKTPLLSARKKQ